MNLAVALAAKPKLRVGLLDADVHGPSVPRMMHLSGRPQMTSGTSELPCEQAPLFCMTIGQDSKCSAGNRMLPLENHRVRCMSMGFLMQVCLQNVSLLDCSVDKAIL